MIDYPKEFLDIIKVGNKLRFYYNENNSNNKVVWIRAIVDSKQIVYRRIWGNRWLYEMGDFYWFFINYRDGYLTLIR